MSYRDEIEFILGEIEAQKRVCLKELKTLPKGDLHVHKAGAYLQFRRHIRHRKGAERISVGRDVKMKSLLLRKAFLRARVSVLDSDSASLRKAVSAINGDSMERIRKYLEFGTGRLPDTAFFDSSGSGLLIPRPSRNPDVPVRELSLRLYGIEPCEWATMPYRENTSFLENKKHIGMSGLHYRSRAEMSLFEHIIMRGFPAHYDETVEINGLWYSPDVIGVNSRREIMLIEYMEMDNADYLLRSREKLQAYHDSGFVLGRNLFIFTCEGNDYLNMPKIDKMLDAIFLM